VGLFIAKRRDNIVTFELLNSKGNILYSISKEFNSYDDYIGFGVWNDIHIGDSLEYAIDMFAIFKYSRSNIKIINWTKNVKFSSVL